MKKILIIVVLHCIVLNGFGQNTVVIQNDGKTTTQTCPYRINGICVTEDIGGVEINIKYNYFNNTYKVEFKNYNKFTVTIIFEYEHEYAGKREQKTGTIVVFSGETKMTTDSYGKASNIKTITRKLKN